MEQFIEKEYKILVSKEEFEKIIKSYDFTKPIVQTNTYYDTKEKTIKNLNGALRIRTINNKKIFTLKIRKDEVTHYEYEKEIKENTIKEIVDLEILSWLEQFKIPTSVEKILSFQTKRYIYEFPYATLCADITSYENHMDYELEYEYKEDHDGITNFNNILRKINKKYEKNCPSKIARAIKD